MSVQNAKYVPCILPVAIVDDASWTTAEVDTKGWDYLELIFFNGANDIAMTALTVTSSDSTGAGHAAVSGLTWGTDANIDGTTSALPSATDDGLVQVAQIDLRGQKRFFDLTATNGDGTVGGFAAAVWRLSKGSIQPNTVAEAGCNELLRV